MSLLHFPSPALDPDAASQTAPAIAPSDAAERRLALDVSRSWIVEAPAGSGKTGLLIQRYLKLLATVERPESVLAITFTRKATAEMRERVLHALDHAAAVEQPHTAWAEFARETWLAARAALAQDRRYGWDLRASSYRMNIRTIDSLCADIARAIPVLSGGLGQASPVENAAPLYWDAARAVLLQLGGANETLNAAIEVVLLHRDGDYRECEALLAEMLATREQWGDLVPLSETDLHESTLEGVVLPKLNAALEEAICSALVPLKRFPSAELGRLARLANRLSVEPVEDDLGHPFAPCGPHAPGFDVADLPHWRALAHLLTTKNGWRKRFQLRDIRIHVPGSVQTEIKLALQAVEDDEALCKAMCALSELPPAAYPADQWRVAKALFRLLQHAVVELKVLFAARQVCDFAELSIVARGALRDESAGGRLAAAGTMQLQHLLVDEMQDTSSSQYELLEALTSGWDGREQTLFLVGDPKQSIYLFRQARVERFTRSLHTGMLGQVPLGRLALSANFRSGAVLVDGFNRTFAQVFVDAGDGIRYTQAIATEPHAAQQELAWINTPQRQTADSAERSADRHRLAVEEAEHIASAARAWWLRPLPHGRIEAWKIAVLVRSKNHAALVTQKLGEAGVPYRGVELEPLAGRQEVLDALAIARALLHPADRTAWLAVLRAPWCGVSLADLHTLAAGDTVGTASDPLRRPFRERATLLSPDLQPRVLRTLDVLDSLVEARGRRPLSVDVEDGWRRLGAAAYSTPAERENVTRFLVLLEKLEQEDGSLTATGITEAMQKLYAEPDAPAGAVDVLTIHKAKGLEWDAVFVPATQRKGGRSDARLLDWLELPPSATGERRVLLAPIGERGDEPSSLTKYIRKARTQQESDELKRVLYVAMTRARTSLQIFASPRLLKDDVIEKAPGTLLRAAWPGVQQEFALPSPATARVLSMPAAVEIDLSGLALAASAEADAALPHRPRPSNLVRVPASFVTPLQSPQMPWLQAAGLAAERDPKLGAALPMEVFERPEGSLEARTLGTLVHRFLQYLAERLQIVSAAAIASEVAAWAPRIRALARSTGLHPSAVQRFADTVQEALDNTLQSRDGLWLVAPHPGASTEEEMLPDSEAGQSARVYRLDRAFLAGPEPLSPGDSVLWIVDYKTAVPRAPDFFAQEQKRYAPQLGNYARLRMRSLPPNTKVRLGLYYPLVPHLHWWPYDGQTETNS